MKLTLININELNDYPDNFIFAKRNIENFLIESNQITEYMKIQEFVSFININNVYYENNIMIPFSIIKTKEEYFIFYSVTVNEETNIILNNLIAKLKYIKYDLTKLQKHSILSIIQNDLGTKPYFMIDSEFYT